MIEEIRFKGRRYPKLQSEGNAAKFAIPFALEICKGDGVDIGCNNEEWKFPGAKCIDIALCDCDAMNLPFKDGELDYVFSSHCLEHLENWVSALDHWNKKLKVGGTMFLYLPNMEEQQYWRPWNNRKHIHYLTPRILREFFLDRECEWENPYITQGYDLNSSFYVVVDKTGEECKK